MSSGELAAGKHRRNAKMHLHIIRLLSSFLPSDWREEICVEAPPFVQEDLGDKLRLIPVKFEAERILDELSPSLDLNKITGEVRGYYLADRVDTINALRMFDSFVRASWRGNEFTVFWAAIRAGRTNPTSRQISMRLESVADLAGYEPGLCAKIMEKLVGFNLLSQSVECGEYRLDKDIVTFALERLLSKLPNRKENLVMDALCCATGASVAEICARVGGQHLGPGTVYKTVEKLKREGYIYAAKHVRASNKGPMRELLSPNCRNCFYGYSEEARCLQDAFREVQDVLERYYPRRRLTDEQRARLFGAISSAPCGTALLKRLLKSLRLINQARNIMQEEHLLEIMSTLREYGIEVLHQDHFKYVSAGSQQA